MTALLLAVLLGQSSYQPVGGYDALGQRRALGVFKNGGASITNVPEYSKLLTVSTAIGGGDGGAEPFWPVVADFNRDGHQDIAVSAYASNQIVILLGNGDGTFRAPVGYPVGSHPRMPAVGDWNLDGIPDLAVDNYSDNTVGFLIGNGDGTFQAQVTVPVQTGPQGLAAGRIGTQSSTATWAVLVGSRSVNLADVIITDGGGGFVVLDGGSDGGAGIIPYIAQPYDAGVLQRNPAFADVTGDGLLDLVFCSNASGVCGYMQGAANQTFGATIAYALWDQFYDPGVYGMAVGDFNNDAISDVAFGMGETAGISLGARTLGANWVVGSTTGLSVYPQGVGSEDAFFPAVLPFDMNNDGCMDLLAVESQSAAMATPTNLAALQLLTGDCNGHLSPRWAIPIPALNTLAVAGVGSGGKYDYPYGAALGDFNEDGRQDIVVADWSTSNLLWVFESTPLPVVEIAPGTTINIVPPVVRSKICYQFCCPATGTISQIGQPSPGGGVQTVLRTRQFTTYYNAGPNIVWLGYGGSAPEALAAIGLNPQGANAAGGLYTEPLVGNNPINNCWSTSQQTDGGCLNVCEYQ